MLGGVEPMIDAAETQIQRTFADRGWAGRLVPAHHRRDLWDELTSRRDAEEIDAALFEEGISFFSGLAGPAEPDVRSMLVVAVPDRMAEVHFAWQGREVAVTVPPTYLQGWRGIDAEVQRVLSAAIAEADHRILGPATFPRKLLAARSGLARYGRNNITYVEGMGSFHRLVALYTSVEPAGDPWQEPEMMQSCESCHACLSACPTGAITDERFLVHAERCLTFWNEKPGDVPFPEWIDPAAHNQLVGCMVCQAVCPRNAGRFQTVEHGPSFTEQETEILLRGVSIGELPQETVAKLEQHDLVAYVGLLSRNLGAVLGSDRAGTPLGG
jgi:epoxyqueuosine reductase